MRHSTRRSGFSLVEVTIALGIASFCLIAIFGLLPTGLNSNKAALEQTAATSLLTAVDADLRAAPNPPPGGSGQSSAEFQIDIPAAGGAPTPAESPITKYVSESGQVVNVAGAARFLLRVWMTPPSAPNLKRATMVRLLVSWPAAATPANAAGTVDSVTALDRN